MIAPDDLVARLRDPHRSLVTREREEAAAEIERLRARLAEWEDEAEDRRLDNAFNDTLRD